MESLTLILQPDPDGNIRLPLPAGMRRGPVKVTAQLEPADAPYGAGAGAGATPRRSRLLELTARIHSRDPFREMRDPVAWQREMREDRDLPGSAE